MKLSNKSADNTSFHNVKFTTTVNELIRVLGEPQESYNTGEDKVNFCWSCELEDGTVVTIYDWKEYKEFDLDRAIDFHIGSKNPIDSITAKVELMALIFNK